MPIPGKCDFFLSRRGSVAAVAQEVAGVLTDAGYSVVVQDYDIPITANFIEVMHEAIKAARDLVVLFTRDYEASPHTRKEFTSFEADRAQGAEERRIVILRCEDTPLRGLFAPNVYGDLVGVDDPAERCQRILAAVEGRSQAQRPPPRPFAGAPPRIPSFTGREAELDRLDAVLMGGRTAAVTQAAGTLAAQLGRATVQGLGGVGKTSLATEYAYRYRDLYAGVWWCAAETRIGLLTSLAGLAAHLGAAAADEADVERAAKAGLRQLAEQRATYLLVYDNVTGPEAISDLLPASGACVLVTSRFPDWGGWAEEVALDVLPPAEATAFLESRAGRQDATGAATLAEALGRLPLALDHAAAYCKRTQMRFADYAAKAGALIAAAPRGASYPRSVAATFQLAIAEAVTLCPAAEALMAYLAQCAPERIPLSLVEGALADEAARTEALLALTDVSLARHDPFEDGTAAVSVHRLVQAVARARAVVGGGAGAAAKQASERLAAIYPGDGYSNPTSWPLCMQLTPHLQASVTGQAGDAEQAELLNRAAGYLYGRADYLRSETLFRTVLAINEQVLGPEHSTTAGSLNNLARLLFDQGRPAAARPLFERALATNEQALGPEHPNTATSLNDLGNLLQHQGDLEGARPLLERALAIYEKALGPEHPSTAASLHNLARLLQAQGNLGGARPLFERALAIYEKALGPEHPYAAASLNFLARLLQAQGDLAGARPLFERALANHEKALGPEHPYTATSLTTFAILLRDQGDLAGARPLLERALAIYEAALGPEHHDTGRIRDHYASLLLASSEAEGAQAQAEAPLT